MRYLLYCRLFFIFAFVSAICSCSLFSVDEEVSFVLPEESLWKITASNGEQFTLEGKSFALTVNKNEPLAVIARSYALGKSTGAIYPYDKELSEEHDFPAQVLYSLVLSSTNTEEEKMYCLATFNWKRFEEDCAELGNNIWKVNKEIVMKKIAGGTFRKSDLKIEKTK